MSTRYTRSVTILPSRIDAHGRLSVPDTFDLFMDVATEAAGEMGVGFDFLKKRGMFWITVKTRIRFIERPPLLSRVQVSTWPEAPGEKRCDRYYEITDESGRPMVQGRTEWAIVSVLTGHPQRIDRLMPEGLAYDAGKAVCPEPFPMIDEAFPEPPFAGHRVVSTDIDMARHMNNVAYVRAIANAFTVKEWKKLNVKQLDVIFRASAHEGDALSLYRRAIPGGLDVRIALPDGTTSALARMLTE